MAQKKSNLAEKAMLADMNTSFWEGRKKDNATTDKTIREAGASSDAGVFWTRIIPPEALRNMQSALAHGRNLHKQMTLPWNDSGTRILPAAMFFDYSKVMREARENFERAVEAFLSYYPTIQDDARVRLGDLYKEEWFPPVQVLRERFAWRVTIYPLPAAEDFRVSLGEEETRTIQKEIEQRVKETVQTATSTLWQKLFDVVQKVVDRLSDPERIFKDSLIGNVVEMIDLLPKLNIADDPNLETMRREVAKKLAGLKPGELRGNTDERKKAADTASAILEKMKGFMPQEAQ